MHCLLLNFNFRISIDIKGFKVVFNCLLLLFVSLFCVIVWLILKRRRGRRKVWTLRFVDIGLRKN